MKIAKKKFYIILAILLMIILGWFGFRFWSFLETPLVAHKDAPVNFLFSQGTSVKKAAYSLQEQKLLKHPMIFVLFVRLSGAEYKLKAGEYVVTPGMTARKLVQKMIKGDVLHHAFTLVEGWNFHQVIKALNDNQYITHTIKNLSPAAIMEKIGHEGELPEGRFAPDTYLFSGNVLDTDILINAYQFMHKQLQKAWDNRDKETLYHCPYEALIVASLIEKETAIAEEKPMIAGVILSRLKNGMLLQVDPTLIYGLGSKFSGKLTRADLQKNTPYNTYRNKGLPPTPIAMPGNDSIEAAMHPIFGTALYYVSKGDGRHEFSDSLKEQNKAVKKYILHK
ncbi:MAG: endolytic transglycosylase MltG [Gammaproteobacteria bacterium]|nr:endolytic transglycosylase MltG [Gammaproteobacteria bacterium]